MRIAFELFGGPGWMGGINYLSNLLSIISELPGRPIEPVLFVGPDMGNDILSRLTPYLVEPPVRSVVWSSAVWAKGSRTFGALALRQDIIAARVFKDKGIDLVFTHKTLYGSKFPIPTIAWVADLQHRSLPQMFSSYTYWKREIGIRELMRYGTVILASSNAGCRESEKFYPITKGKLAVLPFVVRIPDKVFEEDLQLTRQRYGLPEKFLFLPNQFWKHKNHDGLLDALHILEKSDQKIVVYATGDPKDPRNPKFFGSLGSKIRRLQLENQFRFLGVVPYIDLLSLMRASVGLINPSFYEGWSTTVEEAKSLGVPLLLSDIPVHREQAGGKGLYFDPSSPTSIAKAISYAWLHGTPGPHLDLEKEAAIQLPYRRLQFATNFLKIAEQTIHKFHSNKAKL